MIDSYGLLLKSPSGCGLIIQFAHVFHTALLLCHHCINLCEKKMATTMMLMFVLFWTYQNYTNEPTNLCPLSQWSTGHSPLDSIQLCLVVTKQGWIQTSVHNNSSSGNKDLKSYFTFWSSFRLTQSSILHKFKRKRNIVNLKNATKQYKAWHINKTSLVTSLICQFAP